MILCVGSDHAVGARDKMYRPRNIGWFDSMRKSFDVGFTAWGGFEQVVVGRYLLVGVFWGGICVCVCVSLCVCVRVRALCVACVAGRGC